MIRYDVYITLPDARVLKVGEVVFQDPRPNGDYRSAFRYDPAWIDNPDAFPLDPEWLPLETEEIQADRLEPPMGVFRDALPDAWGRRLRIRKAGLKGTGQLDPTLLGLLANHGLGALSFMPSGSDPCPMEDPSARTIELEDLLQAAEDIARGRETTSAIEALFRAGGSPGGVRPKALVRDTDGRRWLAKFPASGDLFDIVGLEAATLRTAALAGLDVPESRLVHVNGGRKALLVERFDVTGADGRNHMLSAASLLGEGAGRYVQGYEEVFEALARHAGAPDGDLAALFRHTVFNAAIGNTDDHLRNLVVVRAENGWGLSPSFDLLPDVAEKREHVLSVDGHHHIANAGALMTITERFRVPRTNGIIEDVLEAVERFSEIAMESGVPDEQAGRFRRDMQRRIEGMRPAGPKL